MPKKNEPDFKKKRHKAGTKKIDEKSTNVTIKSKKLYIQEQSILKEVQADDSSFKSQEFMRILENLGHFRQGARKDALFNLRDFFDRHPDMYGVYQKPLLEGMLKLVTDEDFQVRQALVKVMESMLPKMPPLSLQASSGILGMYINHGLTSLSIGVRRTSIVLLGVLVETAPYTLRPSIVSIVTHLITIASEISPVNVSNVRRTMDQVKLGDSEPQTNSSASFRFLILELLLKLFLKKCIPSSSIEHSNSLSCWSELGNNDTRNNCLDAVNRWGPQKRSLQSLMTDNIIAVDSNPICITYLTPISSPMTLQPLMKSPSFSHSSNRMSVKDNEIRVGDKSQTPSSGLLNNPVHSSSPDHHHHHHHGEQFLSFSPLLSLLFSQSLELTPHSSKQKSSQKRNFFSFTQFAELSNSDEFSKYRVLISLDSLHHLLLVQQLSLCILQLIVPSLGNSEFLSKYLENGEGKGDFSKKWYQHIQRTSPVGLADHAPNNSKNRKKIMQCNIDSLCLVVYLGGLGDLECVTWIMSRLTKHEGWDVIHENMNEDIVEKMLFVCKEIANSDCVANEAMCDEEDSSEDASDPSDHADDRDCKGDSVRDEKIATEIEEEEEVEDDDEDDDDNDNDNDNENDDDSDDDGLLMSDGDLLTKDPISDDVHNIQDVSFSSLIMANQTLVDQESLVNNRTFNIIIDLVLSKWDHVKMNCFVYHQLFIDFFLNVMRWKRTTMQEVKCVEKVLQLLVIQRSHPTHQRFVEKSMEFIHHFLCKQKFISGDAAKFVRNSVEGCLSSDILNQNILGRSIMTICTSSENNSKISDETIELTQVDSRLKISSCV